VTISYSLVGGLSSNVRFAQYVGREVRGMIKACDARYWLSAIEVPGLDDLG
jgi:hypothetical protein